MQAYFGGELRRHIPASERERYSTFVQMGSYEKNEAMVSHGVRTRLTDAFRAAASEVDDDV